MGYSGKKINYIYFSNREKVPTSFPSYRIEGYIRTIFSCSHEESVNIFKEWVTSKGYSEEEYGRSLSYEFGANGVCSWAEGSEFIFFDATLLDEEPTKIRIDIDVKDYINKKEFFIEDG